MTARKYAALTKTSGATATRELIDLVPKSLLVPRGAGRSRRYELTIPGWEWVPLPINKEQGGAGGGASGGVDAEHDPGAAPSPS